MLVLEVVRVVCGLWVIRTYIIKPSGICIQTSSLKVFSNLVHSMTTANFMSKSPYGNKLVWNVREFHGHWIRDTMEN